MNLWVVFEGGVPECSTYREGELDFLSGSLCHWEDDRGEEAKVKAELLAFPLGVVRELKGKRIVMVADLTPSYHEGCPTQEDEMR